MKVLLISIINSYKYGNTGVDYIAQYLRDKCSIQVDTKFYHHRETLEFIKEDLSMEYDFYGFSVFETNYCLFMEIAKYIKDMQRDSIVFMGGQFISMNYKSILADMTNIDYLILGDGESPIKRLLEHYIDSSELLIGDKNIISKNDFLNKEKNIENQVCREHAYDYFINDEYSRNIKKTHCMLTKANICTGACSFCCSRKGRVTYKEPDAIVNEIYYMTTTFGVRKYFFVDDDLFDVDTDINRQRLWLLFKKIDKLNLNIVFSGFAKCKSICNPKNYELIKQMNKIGFHHLFLGVDAGNEKDRLLYNKRSTLTEGIEAIKILKNNGISPRYGMIFINPYSTLETFKENYRYLVELKSSNYYHYGGLKVQLLEGTKLLEKVRNDGLLKKEYSFLNTSAYDFYYPEVKEVVNFLTNELIPQLEEVKGQFNSLKRKYELVRHVNPLAEKYHLYVKDAEQKEFQMLKEYFFHLYEENDINWCRTNIPIIIEKMQSNSSQFKYTIKELEKLYNDTPIQKDGKIYV